MTPLLETINTSINSPSEFCMKGFFKLAILKIDSKTILNGNIITSFAHSQGKNKFIKVKLFIPEEIPKQIYKDYYHIKIFLRDKNNYHKISEVNFLSKCYHIKNQVSIYHIQCELPITSGKEYKTFELCMHLCDKNRKLIETSLYKMEIYTRKLNPDFRKEEFPFYSILKKGILSIEKSQCENKMEQTENLMESINTDESSEPLMKNFKNSSEETKETRNLLLFFSYMHYLKKQNQIR
jgi:hypothetical protein